MTEYKNLPHMEYDYEKPNEYIDPMKPIIEEIVGEFRIQEENLIMRAVADVGIYVDKPRLIQALTDAKAFYEEGYRAAMRKANVVEVRHGEWEKDPITIRDDGEIYDYRCSVRTAKAHKGEYGNYDYITDYCPNCGAKMDGKGEGE